MARRKAPTVLRVLATAFLAFFCSTREGQGQETISAPQECSGTFKVHSTQLTLLIQQHVASQDGVFNCQYVFEAPEGAGLLVFANGITAIDDGEIPGCPVEIYDGDKLAASLCGHYETTIIPVSSPKATVTYRPEYHGSPYTLTLDLQVTRSDDDTSVLCADAELHTVPSVPVRYGVVLRDDGSANGAEPTCDYKVVSNSADETLKTDCLLTSDGNCTYEVLLSNGSQLGQTPSPINLVEVGGEVIVRLQPSNMSGVLTLTLPGDFEPENHLERPVYATDMPMTTQTSDGQDVNMTGGSQAVNMTDNGQGMTTTPVQGGTGDDHDDHDHDGHNHCHHDGRHNHDHGHGHGDKHNHDHHKVDDDEDEDESFWQETITWIWTIEYTMVFTSYSIKSWFWSWF